MAGRRRKLIVFDASEVEFEKSEQPHGALDVQPLEPAEPLDPLISTGPGMPLLSTEVPPHYQAELMLCATILGTARYSLLPVVYRHYHVRPGDFWYPFPRAVFSGMLRVAQYGGSSSLTFSAVQREVERVDGTKFSEHFRLLQQFLKFGEASSDVIASFALEVVNRARLRLVFMHADDCQEYCREGREAIFVPQNLIGRATSLLEEWTQPSQPREADELEKKAAEACARGDFQA